MSGKTEQKFFLILNPNHVDINEVPSASLLPSFQLESTHSPLPTVRLRLPRVHLESPFSILCTQPSAHI